VDLRHDGGAFSHGRRNARQSILLLEAVAPHHISVSAKYVAFADVSRERDGKIEKFAVHDKRLALDDISLLQQVADIVPVASLERGLKRLKQRMPERTLLARLR
jgi:hypothetical protein